MTPEEFSKLTPEQVKMKSRGWSRDMSPEAVARRIDIVSELRDLCIWLGTAKPIEKAKPPQSGDGQQGPATLTAET